MLWPGFIRNWLGGAVPPSDAPKVDKLAWTRGFYVRLLLVEAPVFLLVAALSVATASSWGWLIVLIGAGMWVCGFALVNIELSRARRRASGLPQ